MPVPEALVGLFQHLGSDGRVVAAVGEIQHQAVRDGPVLNGIGVQGLAVGVEVERSVNVRVPVRLQVVGRVLPGVPVRVGFDGRHLEPVAPMFLNGHGQIYDSSHVASLLLSKMGLISESCPPGPCRTDR